MRKQIMFAVAVLLVVSAIGDAATKRRRDANIGMKLAVGPEGIVTILINSDHSRAIDVMPSLELRNHDTGEEYWSPFDKKGLPLPLNGRVKILRGEMVVKLRLDELRWALSRSARWPSRSLHGTVPDGSYDVFAMLSGPSISTTESNHSTILIRTTAKRK